MKHIFGLIIAALCCLGVSYTTQAQELNATVNVEAIKLQTADSKIFKTFENDVREFLNGRKWTDDSFKPEERIECNFQFTITEELSSNRFRAQVSIQSSRPVFKSAYESMMFNHNDKLVEFEYVEYQPIDYNDNTFTNDLGSILAYYAYVIIAYDYDSFAKNGGTPYWTKAQTVVNNAQNSQIKGWQAFDGTRNRYWLVENLLDSRHRAMRTAFYNYHRLGLDMMQESVGGGRSSVKSAIKAIEGVHNDIPNSMAVDVFLMAKKDEVIGIFGDGKVAPTEKMLVLNSMSKMDPSNASQYSKINNSIGKGGMMQQNPAFDNNNNNFNMPGSRSMPKKGR